MVSVKRKRSDATASEDEFSEVSQDYAQSDEEIDISTALTGKRPKVARISKGTPGAGNDWDDDNDEGDNWDDRPQDASHSGEGGSVAKTRSVNKAQGSDIRT